MPFRFRKSLTATGAYIGQGEWPVTSITLDTDMGEETFVQVEKTATWVWKAVGGTKAMKGSLRRVHITIQLLKAMNIKAEETHEE